MAGEWLKTTIGELITNQGGSVKTGPFGTTLKASEYSMEGVPLISVREVGYGTLRLDESTPRVPQTVTDRLPEYILRTGDIVFGRKGAVDRSAHISADQDGWFLGSDGIRLRLPSTCDSRFISYQVRNPSTRSWLIQHATGTTMPSLNQGVIQRVPIVLPPIEEQRAIAYILGTLDDKIELNRRTNETLEAMARAIFKSWFVDFDPVRAKAEGRDPGLPEHVADLFPDCFEDSELGEIPAGWNAGPVGEDFNITMGQSPPGETYNESGAGLPFYQGRRDFGYRYPALRVYCSAPRRTAQAGDALVSVRAPVGDVNMAEDACCVGRGVAAVRHRSSSRSYTYYAMRSLKAYFEYFESEGTVFGAINKNGFATIPFLIPPLAVIEQFESIAFPIDQRIEINEKDSRTLAAIRDALLPRLISGELRIGEAGESREALAER